MKPRTCLLAVGAALGLAMAVPSARAATVEHAKLWDHGAKMGIKIDHPKAPAGKVTFDVTNTSKYLVHEMIVIKVPSHAYKPPYDKSAARIYENKVKDLGEVSELKPGKSGSLTLELEPGLYDLVCNQPGHYMDGMHTYLAVVAPPKPARTS